MSELDNALADLRGHPGVEHVILLGPDGLVIQHLGDGGADEETIAARVPGIGTAGAALGQAADKGAFNTAVVEYDRGVAIVLSLSGDLLLAILVQPNVGFATLLRSLRRHRDQLAGLL